MKFHEIKFLRMCIIIKGGTIYCVYNKYIFVLRVFSSNRHLFVALFIISQAYRETFSESKASSHRFYK